MTSSPFSSGSLRTAPRSALSTRRRGFTLAEVMVSVGIASITLTAVTTSFLQGLNTYHYNAGKLLVNKDIRGFTNSLSENATYANYFVIFPSFTNRTTEVNAVAEVQPDLDANSVVSTPSTSPVTVPNTLQQGRSGDFLVLVYLDPADDNKIARIVGYYRAAASGAEGPVQSFDQTFSPSSSRPLAALLPSASSLGNHKELLELSQGLADGHLFYNFANRSVVVQGEIIHKGSLSRTATNTYNFTVSPRG